MMLRLTSAEAKKLLPTKATKATKATKPRKKSAQNEDELQERVADYLRKNYPDLVFDGNSKNTDLPEWVGAQMKRMGKCKGYPDLFIARAKHGYHGLYLELKRDGEKVRRRDGQLYAAPHIREQSTIHEKLRAEGYWADFVIGYEPAKTIIDWYLGE